jgi:L-ascorbate metabolism protein UlaG (beta-lactamase superfamily)
LSRSSVYLRQNVVLEPLFNEWYAWSHLVAPVTAALHVAKHVKIMQSFVDDPAIHVAALRDPAMLGGPFVSYGPERVPDVRALLDRTLHERAGMLALASAVRDLDNLVTEEAKGGSLEPLYDKVPALLRGFVELYYDVRHRPGYRLIEPLLYRSSLYERNAQSIALSTIVSDERAFVMSTPRLRRPDALRLNLAFDDPAIDDLFAAQLSPTSVEALGDRLRVSAEDEPVLRALVTTEAPRPSRSFDEDGLRVRYYGHGAVLLETREVSVLLDPAVSYPYEATIERFTIADLPPRIDYALLTHNHQDHVQLETLLALRRRIGTVVVPRSASGELADPSLRLVLRQIGFRAVVDVEDLDTVEIPGGSITAIPFLGEHGDLHITCKTAYLIQLGGKRLLFAADSRNFEPKLYEHVRAAVGSVDILFVGMECEGAPVSWVYGPLMTRPLDRRMDRTRRFSGSDSAMALDLVERFGPSEVYVYAMGQEPWLNHILSIQYTPTSRPIVESDRLVATCRARGINAERLFGKKELRP